MYVNSDLVFLHPSYYIIIRPLYHHTSSRSYVRRGFRKDDEPEKLNDSCSPLLLCTFHIYEIGHKNCPSYFSTNPLSPLLLCTFHIYEIGHKTIPISLETTTICPKGPPGCQQLSKPVRQRSSKEEEKKNGCPKASVHFVFISPIRRSLLKTPAN